MLRALIAVCGLLALPAHAQITLTQSATSTTGTMWTTGSLGETLSFSGAVTSGSTVAAVTMWGNENRTMACSHDGNSMTAVGNPVATAIGMVQLWGRVATTTGTGVTCTISGTDNSGNQAFALMEFAGAAATLSTAGGAGVSARTAVETTTATSHDTGADVTPDTAHNVSIGGLWIGSNGGTHGDDGWTMLISNATVRVGYLIQSAATAHDWVPTTTNAVTGEVNMANLDGAAASGSLPVILQQMSSNDDDFDQSLVVNAR